ncbi:MAG: hypothetical protein M4579_007315 [Chaenotheca gracillima]|nr:MAG: hypothetical protein M4579_007315 [Chaenotheca gracillima]
MPPRLNWDRYKDVLEELYLRDNRSLREVKDYMENTYGFIASTASYERQIRQWKFTIKRVKHYNNEELVAKVRLMWHQNMSSKNMLRALNEFEGYPELSSWGLKDLRLRHRLLFQNTTIEGQNQAKQLAEELVQQQLESGQSVRYGMTYSHMNIRMVASSFISRDQIAAATRYLDPIGVAARTAGALRQRARYTVKGPNRIWSADGHDKLSEFGFEIYGIIDGYSRFIVSLYVGLSARTEVGVQKYYLEAVKRYGFPKKVRSDKGNETGLMAECQVRFRRSVKPDLPWERIYGYGTSTKNQRIEAWWNTMASGQTESWKRFFEKLKEDGFFDGSDYDIMALRYIYMPIIRQHISTFVQMHNNHRIRRQRARELYLSTGKPYEMFHYPAPGVRNYATRPDAELLAELEAEVQNYSADTYQTDMVASFCADQLMRAGFPSEFNYTQEDATHVDAYKYLRRVLWEYEQKGGYLSRISKPLGGRNWIEQQATIAIIRSEETNIDDTISEDLIEEDDSETGDNDDDGLFFDL